MTNPAAIKGTYSDLKFIKSRKVAQVVIEVPIEQSNAFVDAFGTPQPDKETWVAIARLGGATATEKPKGGRLAKKAGILCGEPQFHNFLMYERSANWKHGTLGFGNDWVNVAAQAVRSECGIDSRSQLDHSPVAEERFERLLNEYEAWKRGLAA